MSAHQADPVDNPGASHAALPATIERPAMHRARVDAPKRIAAKRVLDWDEVERAHPVALLKSQAERCMGCGVPFCLDGCPLGNDIPDWNALVAADGWEGAAARLHATNNFPEFTGKTCPAPCEAACVRALTDQPVTIRQVERSLADRAWEEGWIQPLLAPQRSGRRVAIVGSGPAGLAAAQQLARQGHDVTVFERDARVGGLLRYGIPDFKLTKTDIDRRVEQLSAEGVVFRTGVDIGRDIALQTLRDQHDAVLLATGAQKERSLGVPGAELAGVTPAMAFLRQANRLVSGELVRPDKPASSSRVVEADMRVGGAAVFDPTRYAAGKHVVVLGGGDTGADCVGTALRQGALSVQNFHYKPAPPSARTAEMPWPWWPMILRASSSHEEGGERDWSLVTRSFEGTAGAVESMQMERVAWTQDDHGEAVMTAVPGTLHTIPVGLVLIAVGFLGVASLCEQPDMPSVDTRGRYLADEASYMTDQRGVWACGDARRGASLVVWAIREGREAAAAIDRALRAPPSRTQSSHATAPPVREPSDASDGNLVTQP